MVVLLFSIKFKQRICIFYYLYFKSTLFFPDPCIIKLNEHCSASKKLVRVT